ncbi:uncharacterized protein DS421_2g45670 [Arachis hypogaea]|nr:uncharacterized protein DS421_2g45670 [Arachis hypogaea]
MSEEKKAIIRDLGFGGLMHIPPLRVHHKLLRELANSFKLGKNTPETSYSSFRVKPSTIGAALGLNASGDLFPQKVSRKELSEDNKQIFRRFQGKTLKNLTDEINNGCLFALMIVYFHLSKNKDKKGEERPAQPWIANWNREQLVERMRAEIDEHMSLLPLSLRLKKTQKNQKGNNPPTQPKRQNPKSESKLLRIRLLNKLNPMMEESANDPAEQNMMVMRVETQSQTEALSIVPIQLYVPLSQTTPVPVIEPSPTKSPREKISEERTDSNPAPEDAAALMMVARTTSYIPKEDPMPSFSLGLTDSSPEEAATQEGQRAKTPEILKLIEQLEELVEKIVNSGVKTDGKRPQIEKQSGEEIFEKFETPARTNEMSAEMKEKCYNMAVGNHPNGELLHPKTKKPFRVEDYPMFIPFLDLKKLASRPYGYVISRMRVYAGGAPLKKKDQEIEPPYINISGQKTSYDYAIYVMKWLEIIQPENVKRGKYEWDNWTQDEVDHYRVEYAFRILFHEMNQDKAEATRGDAIRLSKPSSVLLSPYCQIDSNDIDTD